MAKRTLPEQVPAPSGAWPANLDGGRFLAPHYVFAIKRKTHGQNPADCGPDKENSKELIHM